MANLLSNIAERLTSPSETDGTVKGSNPANDVQQLADPSGDKMKALAWFGVNNVRVIETNRPKVVNDDDVVLKVTGTTVCGSDLHLMHGALVEMRSGDILGHEFCGIVVSVGAKTKERKVGERVVVSFQLACGDCYYCKRKLSSQCISTNSSSIEPLLYGHKTAGMFGYSHLTGGFAGGQAEYVRVPHGDVNCLVIPDGVPDEAALYLSDVLPTSYHCVVDTGVKQGDVVGIWGAGSIGLFCATWSFMKGAARVILIDQDWRLEYAKSKIPQVETLNFKEHTDVPKRILEMTAGDAPGLDVALECAAGEYAKSLLHKTQLAVGLELDSPEILNEIILSTKNFGRVGITGIYAGFCNGLNIGAIMEKGLRFIGNGQAPVHLYWEELRDMLVEKKIDPIDLIVTHRIALDDVAALYKDQDEHNRDLIKAFVETKHSHPAAANCPKLTSLTSE